ncbi:hypothetical protein [Phyllobacterium myrsinacearum]|uniref:hypothetical protein n=1 Tax=Phyllobacterium myrsinacearum TaxID=28101 RepID=UPI0011B4A270|nr:hypothetical protein [Phyllobacterium myrsinacearum]
MLLHTDLRRQLLRAKIPHVTDQAEFPATMSFSQAYEAVVLFSFIGLVKVIKMEVLGGFANVYQRDELEPSRGTYQER